MDNFELIKKNIHEEKTEEIKRTLTAGINSNPPGEEFLNKEEKKKDIKEELPLVDKSGIKKIYAPMAVRRMSAEELEQRRKLFDEKGKALHEKGIEKAGYKIPADHASLSKLRSDLNVPVTEMKNGVQTVVDYVWADNVKQSLKDDIDWLMEYYKIHNTNIMEFRNGEEKKLPIGDYEAEITGAEKIYEYQGVGTNNCFCCSGTALLNQYLRNKNKDAEPKMYFNQNDLRSYEPRFKKLVPKYSAFLEPAEYDKQIAEINTYAGAGKTRMGNIFQLGDFFFDRLDRDEAMLNQIKFNIPQHKNPDEKEVIKNNIKATLVEKINEALSSGNLMSLMQASENTGHYITVTGLKGNTVEYLDSNISEGNGKIYKTTVDKLVSDLDSFGATMEIVWLSKMKSPNELKDEYSNLEYSEENGYSLKEDTPDNAMNAAQTKGLLVGKKMSDKGGGLDGIMQACYIPNSKVTIESETLAEHKWAEAQQEQEEKTEEETEEKQEEKTEEKLEKETEEKTEEKQKEKTEEKTEEKDASEIRRALEWSINDRSRVFTKKEKKDLEGLRKAEKDKILDYEKKNKDYTSFGVGFEIGSTKITAVDSAQMREIKEALHDYLDMRNALFEKHKLYDGSAQEYLDNRVYRVDNNAGLVKDFRGQKYARGGINDLEREELGELWERLSTAVDNYLIRRSGLFKSGRGKERLKQVKRIKERVIADNARFMLSRKRREYKDSLDGKYHDRTLHDMTIRKYLMPTWYAANQLSAKIDLRDQAYKDMRRMQRKNGELPNVVSRMFGWLGAGMINNFLRLGILYEGIGGLVDRSLGFATMMAANTLELAGKIIKAPLKIMSMGVNLFSKYVCGSKKRWRMDYSFTKGWKDIEDGRKIFRRYMKGIFIPAAAVGETFYRGIPYLFGKRYKDGVYKRAGKWTKDIFEDIGKVFKSISYNKSYNISKRADADYLSAWSYKTDEEDDDTDVSVETEVKKKEEKKKEVKKKEVKKKDDKKTEKKESGKEEAEKAEVKKSEVKKEAAKKEKVTEKKTEIKKVDFRNETFRDRIKRRYIAFYERPENKKDYEPDGSMMVRKGIAMVDMLHTQKKISSDKALEILKGIAIKTKGASPEKMSMKTAALEQVFEAMLEFDMSRFSFDKASDLLSGEYEDVVKMAHAAFEIEEKYLNEYEELSKTGKARCALNAEQLKEVRVRWELAHENFSFANDLAAIKELVTKHNINVDEELKLSTDKLYDKAVSAGGNREIISIYNALAIVSQTFGKWKNEKNGGNILGFYEELRKENYKLGDKNEIPGALEAIRARRMSDREAELSRMDFDDQIRERYTDYYNGLKDKSSRVMVGMAMSRKGMQMVRLLHETADDSVEQCLEIYKGLLIEGKTATPEQKNIKASALEKVFETVLSVDMNRLRFDNYSDLLSGSYDEVMKVANTMFEMPPELIDEYESMIKDGKVKCALSIEQFKEVKARWFVMYSQMPEISRLTTFKKFVKDRKIDVDREMKNSYQALQKKIKSDDVDLNNFYSLLCAVKSKEEVRKEKDKNGDLYGFYEKIRKEEHKLGDKDLAPEALRAIRIKQLTEEGMRKKTEKELNRIIPATGVFETKEKKSAKAKEAELNMRKDHAKHLAGKTDVVTDVKISIRREVSIDDKKKLKYSEFEELSNVAVLFADSKNELASMARLLGRGKELKKGEDKSDTVYAALDKMSDQILKLKPLSYDLSSDDALVNNSTELEQMSGAVNSYRGFLSRNPDYVEYLFKQKQKDGTNKGEKVFRQLSVLSALSDYYRLRKLVISDDIYINRGYGEQGYEEAKEDSSQVKRLKKMMRASYQAAVNLQKLAGNKELADLKIKKDDKINALVKEELSDISSVKEDEKNKHFSKLLASDTKADIYIKSLEAERLLQAPAWMQNSLSLDVKRIKKAQAELKEYSTLNKKMIGTKDVKEKEKLKEQLKDHPKHNYALALCLGQYNSTLMGDELRKLDRTKEDIHPRKDLRDKELKLREEVRGKEGIWDSSPVFKGGTDKSLEHIAISDNWNRTIDHMSGVYAYKKTDQEMLEMMELLSIQQNKEKWEKIKADKEALAYYESAFKEMTRKYIYSAYAASRRIMETMAAEVFLLHPTDLIAQMTMELHSALFYQSVITNICTADQKQLIKDLFAQDDENRYQLDVEDLYDMSAISSSLNMKAAGFMQDVSSEVHRETAKAGMLYKQKDYYKKVIQPAYLKADKEGRFIRDEKGHDPSRSDIAEWYFGVDPAMLSKTVMNKKADGEFVLQRLIADVYVSAIKGGQERIGECLKQDKLRLPADKVLDEYETYLRKEGYPPVRTTKDYMDDGEEDIIEEYDPEKLIKLDRVTSKKMGDVLKKRKADPYGIKLFKSRFKELEFKGEDGKMHVSDKLL